MITTQAPATAASYKCDDCGKIIAAPIDQRPACCGQPMSVIRDYLPTYNDDDHEERWR
jgi:hypothetical protein